MAHVSRPSLILSAVKNAFTKLGTGDGTKSTAPPLFKSNVGAAVWEYLIASEVERLGNTRKEQARKTLVAQGIVYDTTKELKEPGTHILYNDEYVQIQVQVNKASEEIDRKQLLIELELAGVPRAKIEACVAKSMRSNRAAQSIRAILVGGTVDQSEAAE